MINKTKKEKLESVKQKFTDSWFEGLKKSWKDDYNKRRLKESYNITSMENKERIQFLIKEIENYKYLITTLTMEHQESMRFELREKVSNLEDKLNDEINSQRVSDMLSDWVNLIEKTKIENPEEDTWTEISDLGFFKNVKFTPQQDIQLNEITYTMKYDEWKKY